MLILDLFFLGGLTIILAANLAEMSKHHRHR
jgi:hypothetical protein